MIMKCFTRFIALAACAVLSCCSIIDKNSAKGDVKVGDTLPHFAVKMHDGSFVTDADLEGKVSVTVFFSVSCKDCKETLPELQKLYDKYAGKISMVLISRAEGPDIVDPFWKENHYTMPYSAQNDRSVYELFAKTVVPRVYISSRDNVVRYVHTDSPNPVFDEMASEVDTLF